MLKLKADGITIKNFQITNSKNYWDNAGIQVKSNHNTIKDNKIKYNHGGIVLTE